ncbi:cytochrome bc1 complex diheme cytochrome c subunit [Pseudoclavibacter albus]|uniref:cytochrome bc1 complex diheme cytochrome c subunit n=1 Tax=Pseudoclavibacter albus TaxID=272241 RepID=UPI000825D4ED|nr:cytochrome c [Pseudoclavibacter alba]
MFKKPRQTRKSAAARRRSPLATTVLLGLALLVTGGSYAALDSATSAQAETDLSSPQMISEGETLFNSNCATCHGIDAVGTEAGPSLVGVGAASVDFQVGTGRMPMQSNAAQAPSKPTQFSDEQTKQLAAYVASLAPGPAIPDAKYLDAKGDAARGAEIFRINCAMCHNVAGAGGALTEGKFAPELQTVEPVHIYEAMITGPQNMPVFNDANLSPEDKRDIITALQYQTHVSGGVAGQPLGSLGPVSEGLFIWIFGIGASVATAVWLTTRPN